MTISKDSDELGFDRVANLIRAVPATALRPRNLDIGQLVTAAFRVSPRVQQFEADIAALPLSKHALIAAIPDLAHAMSYVLGRVLAASKPVYDVAALAEEGAKVLELISADLRTLMLRGVLPAGALDGVAPSPGYQALAKNLRTISSVARDNWSLIEGRSGLGIEDVKRASEISTAIYQQTAERTNDDPAVAALHLLRDQTFTLLMDAYEELRRAIGYLRYHQGDADDITPSLYAGRGGRPRQGEKVAANGSKPQMAEPQSPEPVQDLPPISKDGPFR